MKKLIYWIESGGDRFLNEERIPESIPVIETEEGTLLSDALLSTQKPVSLECGGNGRCGKCRVCVIRLGNKTAADAPEKCPEEVLACQTAVDENMLVWTPDKVSEISGQILTCSACSEQKQRSGRYAAALDIGTTTLAAALIDAETGAVFQTLGMTNPHRRCGMGADLISRIGYAEKSPEALSRMVQTLRSGTACLLERLAQAGKIETDQIERLAVAGNSVMETLFYGLDPSGMGKTPFDPPQMTFEAGIAKDFGLPIAADGEVFLFPLLAGFVGGDLTAGLLALVQNGGFADGPELLVDLGTNGELLLMTPEKIYAASTAAGPAFEGGNIRFGSFARPGAIERVALPGTIQKIGNLPVAGICGSGLVDAIAELLRLGLLRANGRLLSTEETAHLPESDRLAPFENQRAFRVENGIFLTQNDIRQVQLAAGAVRAGLESLLETAHLRMADMKRLNLAGGFGRYLNKENAVKIGLLPSEIPLGRIACCGNTSLAGAVCLAARPELLSKTLCFQAQTVRVELEKTADFTERFAKNMKFPG